MKSIIKNGWCYKHQFGIIHVEGWGNPFLVLTEDQYWDGEHHGYNYWRLEVTFDTVEGGKKESVKLNQEYNLPEIFTPENSQILLLQLQDKFPNAKIKL